MGDRYFDMDEYGNEKFRKDKDLLKVIEDSANSGNMHAMCQMGRVLHYANSGESGGEENSKKAFEWFKKAAKLGHPEAHFKVGFMINYSQGTGQKLDPYSNYPKAMKWYKKAADLGHAEAQFIVGEVFFDSYDLENAFIWFKKAGEQDHFEAQEKVSHMYEYGYGVEQDDDEAEKWGDLARENDRHPNNQY